MKQREIKFRCWDREAKCFNYTSLRVGYSGCIDVDFVCCERLDQFTGLKDKNGKEIYEGDLMSGDYPDEVVWFNERGQWMLRNNKNPDDTLWEILRDNKTEVIGNIYESNNNLN